jgi:hypothetical protein
MFSDYRIELAGIMDDGVDHQTKCDLCEGMADL